MRPDRASPNSKELYMCKASRARRGAAQAAGWSFGRSVLVALRRRVAGPSGESAPSAGQRG